MAAAILAHLLLPPDAHIDSEHTQQPFPTLQTQANPFSGRTLLIPPTSKKWWAQVLKCRPHAPKNTDDGGQTLPMAVICLDEAASDSWKPLGSPHCPWVDRTQARPSCTPHEGEQTVKRPHHVLSPICDSRVPLSGKVVLFWECRVLETRLKAFYWSNKGEKKKPNKRGQQSQGDIPLNYLDVGSLPIN